MIRVALVGNPNCGKTTLFNALTGDNQRVGNWPGVTVEKKTGSLTLNEQIIQITDLPGVYSLVNSRDKASEDEKIASLAIAFGEDDLLVNVIDACHLERHLYLTSQLLEIGKPVIIAINMTDLAKQRGITIDPDLLSQQLQCNVVLLEAHKQIGISALQAAIVTTYNKNIIAKLNLPLNASLQKGLEHVTQLIAVSCNPSKLAFFLACRMLEGDTLLLDPPTLEKALSTTCEINDSDIQMADARYQVVHEIVNLVQHKQSDASDHFTARLDRILLHRIWALPIFFATMYLMFLIAINVGGVFQDFFNISSEALFVQGSAYLLQQIHAPNLMIVLIANGVGKGINTTVTFIPVIASMFFFLSLLEASGYMARAAFAVDKLMRMLGLPGKSFVPMIVGFGCNVPAIMSARTLDCERDKLLTIVMCPFMSCSARLAIYAVFVAAFFPQNGQNVVFSLYMVGIILAVLTGLVLRKTLLPGKPAPLILELPAYHKPLLRRLIKETGLRLKYFIYRAGKLIIPVCVILGSLNALTIQGDVSFGDAHSQSLLSLIGQWLTPIFAPLGITQDNWPATVGLLSGMLAKEVVIGSLNSLYAQMDSLTSNLVDFNLWQALHTALSSIPENFTSLTEAFINPILASAPTHQVAPTLYGTLYHQFDGQRGAYAYLLFILLYIPCVSTVAAIRQEANRTMMWFSITWSFLVAYFTATLFYQLATVRLHPWQTLSWLVGIGLIIVLLIKLIKHKSHVSGAYRVAANS